MSNAIYIITNTYNKVLYIGVSSNLVQRIYQHKYKLIKGFSSKYNLDKLVYFELFDSIEEAIKREKQLKGGSQKAKELLVNSMNPDRKDLYEEIL